MNREKMLVTASQRPKVTPSVQPSGLHKTNQTDRLMAHNGKIDQLSANEEIIADNMKPTYLCRLNKCCIYTQLFCELPIKTEKKKNKRDFVALVTSTCCTCVEPRNVDMSHACLRWCDRLLGIVSAEKNPNNLHLLSYMTQKSCRKCTSVALKRTENSPSLVLFCLFIWILFGNSDDAV